MPIAPFHVEHIIAKQHLGTDNLSNLALACDRCNLFKGTNLSGIDPSTNQIVALYHPRNDSWEQHFQFHGSEIIGLSSTGRATVQLLQLNAKQRLRLREELKAEGRLE